tara:strand:- start:73 stop:786 length:714 start_codon:yes stop_codon:yes gene_type:complete
MPKIDASKYGYISSGNDTTFNSARTSGVTVINQPASSNTLVSQFFRDSGKGGTVYKIARFFCAFDTSSYSSGYTISSLTFNFRNTTSTTCSPTICFPQFIIVKSTAQGSADTNLSTGDFYSDVDYSTTYSSQASLTSSNADASISLNATAVTAFLTGLLKVVVVQYDNDYGNYSGSADRIQRMYSNFASGSSGFDPFIEFTATAIPGYGNDVIGVDSGDIEKVIKIETADIEKVIGV